ncbi:MAG: four helix bundle protein [Alphaproteobacteria bacterium]|nr:four helix bundle protein [Alphaproteobacteria bacterium]
MNNVKNLNVYKRAHLLALEIYKATSKFPREEIYALASQMRRSAYSINSNLSEGGAIDSNKEYKHFIGIAKGSAAELEYQVLLSKDIGYIDGDMADKIINEIQQIINMLVGLQKSIV